MIRAGMTLLYEDHAGSVLFMYRNVESYNCAVRKAARANRPLPQPQTYGLCTINLYFDQATGEVSYSRP